MLLQNDDDDEDDAKRMRRRIICDELLECDIALHFDVVQWEYNIGVVTLVSCLVVLSRNETNQSVSSGRNEDAFATYNLR